MPCVADRLEPSIIYGFFLLHLRKEVFTPSRFNKDIINQVIRLLFRDLDPSFPYNSFKIMRLIIYNVFGDAFQTYAPTIYVLGK
jgi:hypothetical protein